MITSKNYRKFLCATLCIFDYAFLKDYMHFNSAFRRNIDDG